jgi:DNA-directed RNA polymerase specialized sigma24 family protein
VDLRAAFASITHATRRLLSMSAGWTTPTPVASAERAYQRKQQPSLGERLGEAGVQRLITSYRRGATAAELAEACDCSLSTVKRLLRTSNVRLDP